MPSLAVGLFVMAFRLFPFRLPSRFSVSCGGEVLSVPGYGRSSVDGGRGVGGGWQ